MEEDRSCYKYASGVVVYGKAYPGEPVGNDGGGLFRRHRRAGSLWTASALVSDPPDIVREPLRPDEVAPLLQHQPFGQLPGMRPHAANGPSAMRTSPIARPARCCWAASPNSWKRTLKWDPNAEQFIKDDEANRLLSIAKRPPWCL